MGASAPRSVPPPGATEGLNLCVKRAERRAHGFAAFEDCRLRVVLHDGGATWLIWIKRRGSCGDPDCGAKTWIERSFDIVAQAVLTRRADAERPSS